MKLKKVLSLLLAVILCAGLMASCGGNGGSDGSIKIGVIAPLTGDVAVYGTAVSNAVNLYIEELNANGGIGGREVQLITYDDKGDATEATNAYNKLIASDEVVAIVGAVTSTPTIAVAQVSANDNIPVMTPTATHPDVTTFGTNVFRACFLDPFQGSTMAKYAANELGAKTAAVIYNNSDSYSTGLYESFCETAKEVGLDVVASESYATQDSDYKSQLTNIIAKNPDVIFVPDYYNTVYLIASQADEAGFDGTLLGVDGTDGVLSIDGVNADVLDGLVFANHYSTDDPSELVQNFLKNFEEKYDETPNALAALGYDGVRLLCAAIEKVSADMEITNDPECWKAIIGALAETDMDGVTGHITYDENNNPQKTCAIIKISDGKYELLGQY